MQDGPHVRFIRSYKFRRGSLEVHNPNRTPNTKKPFDFRYSDETSHCPKGKETEVLQSLAGREDRRVMTKTAPKASNPMTQVPASGTATGVELITG